MFIETKMHPPHLRGAMVERTRLVGMLETATAGKLAIVSSPAGFGKSTLLAQWAAKGGGNRTRGLAFPRCTGQ
jgi:LuxR family maltose regulon positive regulatory protein